MRPIPILCAIIIFAVISLNPFVGLIVTSEDISFSNYIWILFSNPLFLLPPFIGSILLAGISKKYYWSFELVGKRRIKLWRIFVIVVIGIHLFTVMTLGLRFSIIFFYLVTSYLTYEFYFASTFLMSIICSAVVIMLLSKSKR